MSFKNTQITLLFLCFFSLFACSDKSGTVPPGLQMPVSPVGTGIPVLPPTSTTPPIIPAVVTPPYSPSAFCGNGLCEAGETATSCSFDCVATAPTPSGPTTPPGSGTPPGAVPPTPTPGPEFEIVSLDPNGFTKPAGTQQNVNVVIRRLGETGDLSLRLEGTYPATSGIQVTPVTIPSASSTGSFTVRIDAATVPQIYEVKISVTSSSRVKYFTFMVKVDPFGTAEAPASPPGGGGAPGGGGGGGGGAPGGGGTPGGGGSPASPSFEVREFLPRGEVVNAGGATPTRVDVAITRNGDEGEALISLESVSPAHSGITVFPEAIRSGSVEGAVGISVDAAVPQDMYYLNFRVASATTVRNFTFQLKVDPPLAGGSGGAGSSCGNRVCDSTETSFDCPGDCPRSIPCNNDLWCDDPETATSCPHDCVVTSNCNFDNTCNAPVETTLVCPHDCSAVGGTSFTVRTDPVASGSVAAGATFPLRFLITRNGDEGPIRVRFESATYGSGASAGRITATPITIPAGVNEGTLNLVVSRDMPVGEETRIIFGLESPSNYRTINFTLSTLARASDTISPLLGDTPYSIDGSIISTIPRGPVEPCTQANRSIWVSLDRGNSDGTGTVQRPFNVLQRAIDRALEDDNPKDLCLTNDTYNLQGLSLRIAGPVKIYGGYSLSPDRTISRRNIREDSVRRSGTVLTNNGSAPVVIIETSDSTHTPYLEGLYIKQDNRVPIPAMSIRQGAPTLKFNTIHTLTRFVDYRSVQRFNYKKVALELLSSGNQFINSGTTIDSNVIESGFIISGGVDWSSSIGILLSNQSVNLPFYAKIKNNVIQSSRATKASIGILANRMSSPAAGNIEITDNQIFFKAAGQTRRDVALPEYVPSSDPYGPDVPGVEDIGPEPYLGVRKGGISSGIVLGFDLGDTANGDVLRDSSVGMVKIQRNKIRYNGLVNDPSGYSSYGIYAANNNAPMMIGSNFITSGPAQYFSTALGLKGTDVKVFNNVLVSNTAVSETQYSIDSDTVCMDCALSTSLAIYPGSSRLSIINNILTTISSGPAFKTGVNMAYTLDWRAVTDFRYNLFDSSRLGKLMFGYLGTLFSDVLVTPEALRYVNEHLGSPTRGQNIMGNPNFSDVVPGEYYIRAGIAAGQGLCDASFLAQNPRDVDANLWSPGHCNMGASQWVVP